MSEADVQAVHDVVLAHPACPKSVRFVSVSLVETKSSTNSNARVFQAVLLDRPKNRCIEARVDVLLRRVVEWKEQSGHQPMVLYEEYDMVDDLVKRDSSWRRALAKRGILDTNDVVVDAWAVGALKIPGYESSRLMRGVSYVREKQTNFYGRPIEGLTAVVDLVTQKVVKIIDNGVVPIAGPSEEFFPDSHPNPDRARLHRMRIEQSATNVEIDENNFIQWQGWRFQVMLHPREGLVLRTVSIADKGKLRSVLHRLALSEMVVPYGDTASNWTWRNAFDVGEYGVGNLTFPMDSLNDAPANARFLDAVLADNDGLPVVRPRVIAVYERDGGLLWKHFEQYSGRNESRRARELVVSSITTVGNYDYALNYIFRQDGSIKVEAQLSGIMLPKGVVDSVVVPHDQTLGHLVTRRVMAPNHQHFFCFRIDADVDGVENSLSEIDAWSPPAYTRENPSGNALVMDEHTLRYEREAQRMTDSKRARCWRVSNPMRKNRIGENSSYLLVPSTTAWPVLDTANIVRKRAAFLNSQLWATQYNETELYAAGDYPNQSSGGAGLPEFCADNQSLEQHDVVLWYVMGLSHIPRAEEFPIMNVHNVSFSLLPAGFFDENPALDVAPAQNED